MKKRLAQEGGISLIEVTIAATLLVVVLALVYSAISPTLKLNSKTEQTTANMNTARAFLRNVEIHMRNASQVIDATDNSFTFDAPVSNNGSFETRRIHLYWDTAGGQLKEVMHLPDGSVSGTSALDVSNEVGTQNIFNYCWKEGGAGSPTCHPAADPTMVRSVELNLIVNTAGFAKGSESTLHTRVGLMNLGTGG